jgi:poly(A) polymerase
MDIEVSHVKRKEIPLFVFPGGVCPSRTSRTTHKNSCAIPTRDVSADDQVGNLLGVASCSDAQHVPCKGSYMKQLEPDFAGGFQLPGSISLLPPSLPNKVVLNGSANFHAESIESEHPEHYQESKFAAVQNTMCLVVKQPNSLLPNSNNDSQLYGSDSSLNSSKRECAGSAANNLLKLSPAIPATPDELDELVSYQTNQKDVNAENNLEIGSENNLEQICSLRPQESNNNLKRKVNQELEV